MDAEDPNADKDAAQQLPPLYLPVDGLTRINESAEILYKGLAKTGNFFLRDDALVKARKSTSEGVKLKVITDDQLPSQMEYCFTVVKKYRDSKGVHEGAVNCSAKEAKA